jgi:hypothetical protein
MLTRRNIIVVVGLLAVLAGVVAALGLGAMKVAQADRFRAGDADRRTAPGFGGA